MSDRDAEDVRRLAEWNRGLASYYRDAGRARQYGNRFAETRTQRAADRAEQRAVDGLLARVVVPDGARWLDVPSGAGRFPSALVTRGASVVAADVSAEMLAQVDGSRARGRVCASAFALPFGDGTFEGAICLRFLHHFEHARDRRGVLRELARVTREHAVVSYFDAASVPALRRRRRARRGGRATARFSQAWAEFREDLAAAGLEPVARRFRARFLSEWVAVLVRHGRESSSRTPESETRGQ